jgi:hypothetical protein
MRRADARDCSETRRDISDGSGGPGASGSSGGWRRIRVTGPGIRVLSESPGWRRIRVTRARHPRALRVTRLATHPSHPGPASAFSPSHPGPASVFSPSHPAGDASGSPGPGIRVLSESPGHPCPLRRAGPCSHPRPLSAILSVSLSLCLSLCLSPSVSLSLCLSVSLSLSLSAGRYPSRQAAPPATASSQPFPCRRPPQQLHRGPFLVLAAKGIGARHRPRSAPILWQRIFLAVKNPPSPRIISKNPPRIFLADPLAKKRRGRFFILWSRIAFAVYLPRRK